MDDYFLISHSGSVSAKVNVINKLSLTIPGV